MKMLIQNDQSIVSPRSEPPYPLTLTASTTSQKTTTSTMKMGPYLVAALGRRDRRWFRLKRATGESFSGYPGKPVVGDEIRTRPGLTGNPPLGKIRFRGSGAVQDHGPARSRDRGRLGFGDYACPQFINNT